jgi:hypothetical protein
MASRRDRDERAEFMRQRAAFLRRHAADVLGRVARVGRGVWDWIDRRLLPSRRVLMAVGLPLFLIGWAIMPGWKAFAWIGGSGLATMEFPINDIADVAVDSQGRIYVADSFHSRVQRYSPDGEFEHGWFVPTSGVFALRTTANDEVKVATARANKLLKYNIDGELLDGEYWLKEDYYQEYASETETSGPYAIRRGLFPHIVDTRTGETVIETPWYKCLLMFPFPSMLYAAVGLGIIGLAELKRHRERRGAPSAESDPNGKIVVVSP